MRAAGSEAVPEGRFCLALTGFPAGSARRKRGGLFRTRPGPPDWFIRGFNGRSAARRA